jgi:hypothetical protein
MYSMYIREYAVIMKEPPIPFLSISFSSLFVAGRGAAYYPKGWGGEPNPTIAKKLARFMLTKV